MKLINIIAIILYFIFPSIKGHATHIVGGELYYESLGNNQYRVILKVYRDCINGLAPFDNPASVGVFDNLNNLVTELLISNPVVTQIPVVITNPCLVVPPVICTEEAIYIDTITLPPIAGGYDLVYQRCCRNNIIQNIVNPSTSGSTYISHIPDVSLAVDNNSAYFLNLPPLVLCNGEAFVFDHSAVDPDGDQLVYEFCDPFLGANSTSPMPQPPNNPPYSNIAWAAGYNINNQILGVPNLQINATTGQLTCTPSTNGIYVVGICVKEYRAGVLINTTLRDFQFTVVTCSQNTVAAVPNQTVLCDGYTLVFSNQSASAASYFWDFGVPGIISDTSILTNPTYTYPDTGFYQVTLIANPGWPCADTAFATYMVQYPILGNISPVSDQCLNSNNYNFNISGNFTSSASVNWNFGAGIPSTSVLFSPSNVNFPTAGIQSVTATISDRNCSRDFTIPFAIIQDPTAVTIGDLICNNLTFSPVNNSLNATEYFWDFGVNTVISDTSMLQTPTYTYQQAGIYNVTLIANNQGMCFDTTTALFDIREPVNLAFSTVSPQCVTSNSFDFFSQGNYGVSSVFNWVFGSNASVPNANTPNPTQIVFDTSGNFAISLIIEDNGCFDSIMDTVLVFPVPEFNSSIVGDTGCSPYTVQFIDSSSFEGLASFSWDFGDGNASSEQSPIYTYTSPGTYTVSFTLNTLQGCTETFQQIFPSGIVVQPSPIANFSITEPDITETVTIADLSSVDVVDLFFLIEGNQIDSAYFDYTFEGMGFVAITEIVVNQYNCSDTMVVSLEIIPDEFIYIPNSFTPNGDGINDDFKPVIYGLISYQFMIFNRWGSLIYLGNESSPAWDGSVSGDLVQQDLYVWKISYKNYNGIEYQKIGHVSVIR